ncbi:MAG: autotransporter domain-containing protein [Selenomonadaceae bacterium]|nr:autotransporter domain-containing protein [Selenomonadaceae bacterium]
MEMVSKKNMSLRKKFLAVAIFVGMSMTNCHAAEIDSTDATADAENFSGQTFSSEGELFTNAELLTSAAPNVIGLDVSGKSNYIVQNGDIIFTGDGAIGVRLGGSTNMLNILSGVIIRSEGAGGKGVLVFYGRDHRLHIAGNIFAAGNAVEIAGDDFISVNEFNLSGSLEGGERAIYIGPKALVRTINIKDGAQIIGDITSLSGRVTNFNIDTDFNYGGKILGANNLNVNVISGTTKFSNAASVASVTVMSGAKFFGDEITTKTFTNHGTIGAHSSKENLIIYGDLISDGFLQKVSGGEAGMIMVSGTANIEGSTVTTDSLLPNETATVLVADSITGNITNPTGKPVPISAMLNATGEIVGNTLTVTTHEADNIGKMNSQEAETLTAMKNMFGGLDSQQQEEMRDLYNLEAAEAKKTLTQISSNDSAQVMSVAQQSTAVDKMISNRVTQVFAPEYIDVNVSPMNFADGDNDLSINVKVPTRRENNLWLNYMKNWGNLRGGTDYHGSVIVGGYDKSFGDRWRAGIFATYGTIGYGADSSRATVYDTRGGLYAGYHSGASDLYLYINAGQLRNSLHRGIYSLGLSTNAKYKSHIIEVGGEYKYDLQPHKTWHVSPFINVQASHIKQNAYTESGAGIYNQHVDANSNTYFAGQVGLDFKRYYRSGSIGLRFGVKHGFTGVDPELHISYEGDGNRNYRLRQRRDKTHFVFSLRGENEFAHGWFVGGETELQLGEHDKDVTASVMLRRMW